MRTILILALVSCAAGDERRPGTETGDSASGETDTSDDTDTGGDSGDPDCELGLACNPIPIDSFPYEDSRDTTEAPGSEVDAYACAPTADESGPEWFYEVTLESAGVLGASLADGDGVDIDLHLLRTTEADTCWARGHVDVGAWVEAGRYILVADTWVDGAGAAQSGAYTLRVDFHPTTGDCALQPVQQRMYWSSCADGIDCVEQDGEVLLNTPTWGPVVKEAHLVTVEDDFGGGWPTSFTDGIEAHYALSEAATGADLPRDQPWAPAGEGGSEFGQGSTGSPLPVEAEAWYVNMYWKDRPAKGRRMLVMDPLTGDAVVTAAGYETGPGSNEAIGGAVEEVHLVLGTGHRDGLVMGYLTDDSLPLGPIDCE